MKIVHAFLYIYFFNFYIFPEKISFAKIIFIIIGGEIGQPVEVDELVFGGQLKNGFFLEAGAWDCEKQSDSLHFEMKHGWTGLLGITKTL